MRRYMKQFSSVTAAYGVFQHKTNICHLLNPRCARLQVVKKHGCKLLIKVLVFWQFHQHSQVSVITLFRIGVKITACRRKNADIHAPGKPSKTAF